MTGIGAENPRFVACRALACHGRRGAFRPQGAAFLVASQHESYGALPQRFAALATAAYVHDGNVVGKETLPVGRPVKEGDSRRRWRKQGRANAVFVEQLQ